MNDFLKQAYAAGQEHALKEAGLSNAISKNPELLMALLGGAGGAGVGAIGFGDDYDSRGGALAGGAMGALSGLAGGHWVRNGGGGAEAALLGGLGTVLAGEAGARATN